MPTDESPVDPDDPTVASDGEAGLGNAPTAGIEKQRVRAQLKAELFDERIDPAKIGRFTILDRLGAGGMGVVYLAEDPELGRKLAIKVVRSRVRGEQGRARLQREAQAMAQVSHPNLVTVYDVGTIDDQVFIAMEYIDGQTLREWLEAESRTPHEILTVFSAAGKGLAAAHGAGFIHRDFKPDNVIVGRDGSVRVLDFGLAGTMDEQQPEPEPEASGNAAMDLYSVRLTQTGAVMGTPAYMSAEQHRGLPTDARTDVFSFSVALFEALYGDRPFTGANVPALMANVVGGKRAEPEKSPAGFPPSLEEVLDRGLANDMGDRFPSMEAMLSELEGVAGLLAAGDTPVEDDALGRPLILVPIASLVVLGYGLLSPFLTMVVPILPATVTITFGAVYIATGVTLLGSAVLVAVDASQLGFGRERHRDSRLLAVRPTLWGLVQLVLWPVAYALYMRARVSASAGIRDLGRAALVLALLNTGVLTLGYLQLSAHAELLRRVKGRGQPTVVLQPTEQAMGEAARAMLAISLAPNDAEKKHRAEAYLATYGETGGPARRAIADAILGDTLWRASCETETHGLCILVEQLTEDIRRCRTPARGPIRVNPRQAIVAEDARKRLDAALAAAAGAEGLSDPLEREAFADAVAMARLRIVDADLERHLGVEPPPPLDGSKQSQDRWAAHLATARANAAALANRYAAVVEGDSDYWAVVALQRSGIAWEGASEPVILLPPPKGMKPKTNRWTIYCDELTDQIIREARSHANLSFKACSRRATETGLSSALVDVCDGRMAALSTLDRAAIREEIRANIDDVRTCYSQLLAQDPKAAGRVVVRFNIGHGGAVVAASATEDSDLPESLQTCVVRAVRGWTFQAPGKGEVAVTYPFDLAPG